MKASKIIISVIAVVVIVPIVAIAVLALVVDPNKYRPQITDLLTKQLGREVKIDGKLSYGMSLSNGINLEVNDVSVANPTWASRPLMAKIGQMELGVGLIPLLQHQVQITAFKLSHGDIQLETNASGQNNWDFKKPVVDSAPQPTPSVKPSTGQTVSIHVDKIEITDSRLAMRGKDGSMNDITVQSLTLDAKGDEIDLSFLGGLKGIPLKIKLSGGALEKIMSAEWPFKTTMNYGDFEVEANGNLKNAAKSVDVQSYTVTAHSTKITGQMNVALNGAKPSIKGTVNSDKINVADFASPASSAPNASTEVGTPAASQDKRMFSSAPLDLSALKTVNADLEINSKEIELPSQTLEQVQTHAQLTDGRMNVQPLNLMLNGSKIDGHVVLNVAVNPAALETTINVHQLDLAKYAPGGAVKGLADAVVTLSSNGNSVHDFASTANGKMDFTAAGSGGGLNNNFVEGLLGNTSSGLVELLGGGLNCAALRFTIQNGLMQSNGILFDNAQATLAGSGTVNLRDETLDILLKTKAKVADISAYTPYLRLGGSFMRPRITPDTASSVQKIAGAFLGGGTSSTNDVPSVVSQTGQNACVYTLDHPAAQPAKTASPANGLLNGTGSPQKLKDVGKQLLNGLFGK